MKGFKAKALLGGVVAAGLFAVTGCCDYEYYDLVDPCWPQRYNCKARHEVNTPLATQAANGQVLEQTVWNHHFVTGPNGEPTAVLHPAGRAHLDYLVRRRPYPMPEIYLQTAHDLPYDPANPGAFAELREKLDKDRAKAIQDYLSVARADVPFHVTVHDPAPVGISGVEAARAVDNVHYSSVGNLPPGEFGEGLPRHGTAREQFGPAGGVGASGQTAPAAGPEGPRTGAAFTTTRALLEDLQQNRTEIRTETIARTETIRGSIQVTPPSGGTPQP